MYVKIVYNTLMFFNIFDFSLSDEDMKKVDGLDLGHSEIIDHNDPGIVKYILSATTD